MTSVAPEARDDHGVRMGVPPENRRQAFVKSVWMLLWMAYLVYPVEDLVTGGHSLPAVVLGWLALIAYLAVYMVLVLRRNVYGVHGRRGVAAGLAFLLVVAAATVILLGGAWVTLYIYTSVAMGAALPSKQAMRGVAGTTLLLVVTGEVGQVGHTSVLTLAFSSFLGGAAMAGVQRLVRTMQELREARETIAHLAAAEERLRLARDLHDLLGHSLSLITLKSELAGRFLDQDREADARAQVADIEQVSRQALVDVREAVGGYRRPKLVVELAAARTALAAAKVELDVPAELRGGELPAALAPEEEGALGWALRESVTNVVRHSGADRCTVRLEQLLDEDGAPALRLEVTDNGTGPGRSGAGNGLTGLGERLALVDGRLETSPGPGGSGFRLRAVVPLRRPATVADAASGRPDTVHP
jgi:two-component system sensor histidine kinase DesK